VAAPAVDDLEMGATRLGLAVRSMWAIGTTAEVVVTDGSRADEALSLLGDELRALDEACSRFRADSELRQVELHGSGGPVPVSPLLYDALDVACRVASETAGIVDPTIGSALIELGYDRDFDEIGEDDHPGRFDPRPAPGWWRITLDPDARTVAIPIGVHVDLGATAKAFAADRAAAHLADRLGGGVLVNLGGDVAVGGTAPWGGWPVGIASGADASPDQADQVVTVVDGGVATSGTTARTWLRNGRRVHHIVDPWTGQAAPPVWSLVSVAAPSCVEANAWSTAAVVWGEDAVGNLSAWNVPARLVDARGHVVRCGGWPPDEPTGPTGSVA
jgi:thiamine biosynthesis lipoprotein